MTYLFWAFAAVWIAIFLYLYALIRRSQALAREVEALRGQSRTAAHSPALPPVVLAQSAHDVAA